MWTFLLKLALRLMNAGSSCTGSMGADQRGKHGKIIIRRFSSTLDFAEEPPAL